MSTTWKSLLKPTPVRFRILAASLKTFFGTIGASAIIGDYKWVGIGCLVMGAFFDLILNGLSEKEYGSD